MFIIYYLFILSKGWQKQKGKLEIPPLFILFIVFFCWFRARVVPENILKKQARDAKLLKALKQQRVTAKTERAAARKVASANAEKYFNEYQTTEDALIKAKRDAKAKGTFFVEGEPKVAFIIRIKG